MTDLNKIRTTIRPEDEIEVTDRELTDLKALGIVLDTSATTPEDREKAAIQQVTANAGTDENPES